MNLKDLIAEYAKKDPLLFSVLTGLIEAGDVVRNDFDTLVDGLQKPDYMYGHSHIPKRARVHRGADQSIASGAAGAAISWSSPAIFDNDVMYDATTPTRLTMKTPGWYMVGGAGRFENPAVTSILQIQLKLNGVTIIDIDLFSGRIDHFLRCVTLWEFAKNDYIELFAIQNSGAALNFQTLDDYAPVMWAHQVERGRNLGPLTENCKSGEFNR